MRYLSVCSGIEAASVAWQPLGWSCAAVSEIEPFPNAVLAHHYPNVPNAGDFTKIKGNEYGNIDLVIGGTPCQSFSVAGLRQGLDDDRGNLALEFIRLLERTRSRWFVWENVPGVLSSSGGQDFTCFLSAVTGREISPQAHDRSGIIAGTGEPGTYSVAWRILDAQHFGVPQRRRRLFVVGYSGSDWRASFAALFERESLSGHTAPNRTQGKNPTAYFESSFGEYNQAETSDTLSTRGTFANSSKTVVMASGKNTTGALLASAGHKQFLGNQEAMSGDYFIPGTAQRSVNITTYVERAFGDFNPDFTSDTLKASSGYNSNGSGTLALFENHPSDGRVKSPLSTAPTVTAKYGTGGGNIPVVTDVFSIQGNIIGRADHHGGNGIGVTAEKAGTLTSADRHGVAYTIVLREGVTNTGGRNPTVQIEKSHTLVTGNNQTLFKGASVRRLTPVECERLQGFPDNWTQVPYRGKSTDQCPMGQRYKAIGNSMAVPVIRWIGERISYVDSII